MRTDKVREQTLKRYYTFREKHLTKWRKTNKEASRRYRAKNKDKVAARRKVFIEVRSGRLKKKPCFCGSVKVQAHHHDYTKPLDIKWFCAKHHREYERLS